MDYTGKSIAANYFRGMEAVGGAILFDVTGFTFKAHAVNIQTGDTRIGYAHITSVEKRNTLGVIPNGMSVFTADGSEHKFVLNNRAQVIGYLKSKCSTLTKI